jgi:LmbE family N-acetylglucosaminyl deacetylase
MGHTVLAIAPHPDDEVLGCGGTLARHASQGDAVHVLIVTRGDPDLYPNDDEAAIHQEIEAAHHRLGVASTTYLNFPAPRLDTIAGYQLAEAIAQVIDQTQPDTLYLPHHGDIHVDHQRVYQAALVAARPINHCPVRRLLCYETLSETEWSPPQSSAAFVPTAFSDISDFLEIKLQAMGCYGAELRDFPHPRSLPAITALAQLRGATVGLAAAEAFAVVRQIL